MNPDAPPIALFDETTARQVLLLRACESPDVAPSLWSPEDSAWASRVALQTVGTDAPPARFLAERARQALQRLLPRDPSLGPWLTRRGWRWRWLALVLLGGGLLGMLADTLAGGQRIDLMALPVWGVIAWNLVIFGGLTLQSVRGLGRDSADTAATWPRRWLVQLLSAGGGPSPVLRAAAGAWAQHGSALALARATALMHAAAAALALGLIDGLYLRGLVFDIRAGWQSTFLDPGTVQWLLATLLAPASALTGIEVPDAAAMAALRVLPGQPASASAAPWIHLFAAMLALFVVLPRAVLAAWALGRAWRGARAIALPLSDPYFQRLLLAQRGQFARVQVLPHAAEPGAQAALGLRTVLAGSLGDGLQLRLAAVTAFGDEEGASALAAESGTTLRVALFDLGTTPEAESQGRFVQTLQQAAPGLPVLMVVDETAFRRRFGGLADRLAERRAGWQRLGAAQGCTVLCVDLEQPDLAAAGRALGAAGVR